MTDELKAILRPPFRVIDYPEDNLSVILSGRGGFSFQLGLTIMQGILLTKAGCYEEFKDWLAEAVNEKYLRDAVNDTSKGE